MLIHPIISKKKFDISRENKSKFKICPKTSKFHAITKAEWQKMKDDAGKLNYLSQKIGTSLTKTIRKLQNNTKSIYLFYYTIPSTQRKS